MKRIKYLLFAIVMVLFLLPVHASAETIEESLPPPTEEVVEEHTLFTRLWEYVEENSAELIDYAIGVASVILLWVVKSLSGKGNAKVLKRLDSVKRDTDSTTNTQGAVIETVGKMVAGYNELRESYERYGATEDDRNRVVGALVAQNTAILEILTTVYCNNSNLPQGAKDLVQLTYANCLKTLDNDEQVRAIITAVRNNIGAFTKAETDSVEEA